MLLSVRFLNDVSSANSYEIIDNPEFFAGDAQTIHIQLIDASLDREGQGFNPPGRRYLPPTSSTLTASPYSQPAFFSRRVDLVISGFSVWSYRGYCPNQGQPNRARASYLTYPVPPW